ncbi:LemA family protein [Mycoplasma phocoenae]|uniref:LemA family protein n=1 Tax=Mycoplasma phocoenae TaxID=754517 RepID=A0A858U447_9MOLU|nr:LemA family protein [Mycoplasma phocoenae]QJG67212.1 LemA family protein [Mycoplasma phocoenae]
MLFDSRNEQKDVTINVDTAVQVAKATAFQKTLWIVIMIITLGIAGFWRIKWGNEFNKLQVQSQESSSLIQAAQAKRRASLIKMIDAVKGYKNHEKETLEQITKYRSKLNDLSDNTQIQNVQNTLDQISRGLSLTIEKYPELKADSLYKQFMNESILQEDEIYAARRVYNKGVNYFNQLIYTFPRIVKADHMKLHNLPFFTATQTERQDVDTSGL